MSEKLPLLKGTLDLLILKALSVEPTHGYGLAVWLEARSGGALDVDDSAIYQSLRRMESRGWVSAEWGISENNRRARYYELTPAGRRHLADERDTWQRYAESVAGILAAGSGRSTEPEQP
jgi:transcriptional regulator